MHPLAQRDRESAAGKARMQARLKKARRPAVTPGMNCTVAFLAPCTEKSGESFAARSAADLCRDHSNMITVISKALHLISTSPIVRMIQDD